MSRTRRSFLAASSAAVAGTLARCSVSIGTGAGGLQGIAPHDGTERRVYDAGAETHRPIIATDFGSITTE